MTRPRRLRVGASSSLLLAAGCIIPDRDIQFEGDVDNPGAVRIVEPIDLPLPVRQACEGAGDLDRDPGACPQVPDGLRSGLIRLRDLGGQVLPLCVCPAGDTHRLPEFFVYAEDPDRSGDRPADTLHAAALLDLDPLTDEPHNAVAYNEHFANGLPGERIGRDDLDLGAPIVGSPGRQDNGLWRFRFGKDGGLGTDLCNDDDGEKLTPGLHNLQIMVTDRPFFRYPRLDALGEPVLRPDGSQQMLQQIGMPDLAGGATWAIANYVFECVQADTMGGDACDCEEAP